MKHANVAIFVPHNGCPHQCSFCNQRSITGQSRQPGAEDVKNAAETALKSLGDASREAEIAFFGGSFTAIERSYMLTLLNAAEPYLDRFKGIRLSTRPDCIDREVLDILKQYKTTAIELGVQSMRDSVLKANRRGHTAKDVCDSSRLIKESGISLGLQMMTNLYKSTVEDDLYTAKAFLELAPDTVRIYPTAVLADTELAQLYYSGIYKPYTLEESVAQCAELLKLFEENGIKVIRLGLHSGGGVDSSFIAGAYHPAFRELCESKIMLDGFLSYLKTNIIESRQLEIYTAPRNISASVGQRRSNIKRLDEQGFSAVVRADNSLKGREFIIKPR